MQRLYDLLRSCDLSPAELARRVGVNKGNVSHWNRFQVPAARVPAIAEATGIPPEKLRPDLYREANQ
jgi:DNA-binding transcriptional regulator YdaS (Cro superfamily)